MLKNMFNQFLLGENAKLMREGTYPHTNGTTIKYYMYQSEDKTKHMTVIVDVNSNFSPHQIPELIANDVVTIRFIEFS